MCHGLRGATHQEIPLPFPTGKKNWSHRIFLLLSFMRSSSSSSSSSSFLLFLLLFHLLPIQDQPSCKNSNNELPKLDDPFSCKPICPPPSLYLVKTTKGNIIGDSLFFPSSSFQPFPLPPPPPPAHQFHYYQSLPCRSSSSTVNSCQLLTWFETFQHEVKMTTSFFCQVARHFQHTFY